jgi:hypothetical protein
VIRVTLSVPPKEAAMNRPPTHPRPFVLVVLLAALSAVLLALASPASAATTSAARTCHVAWGSQAKSSTGVRSATDPVTKVRAGEHRCFDRLVVDLSDARGVGYDVRNAPVSTEGRGLPVPLRGAADLRIVVRAPAYDLSGHATFTPRNPGEVVRVTGFHTFRQVAYAGSFEGQTTFGLGVRARLPFRVFVLAGSPGDSHGARLVVDVARSW